MSTNRKSYPSDVTDGEWEFLVPNLSLMREDAPQREHSQCDVFNELRYMVKTGYQWWYLENDFLPWTAVYQHVQRWMQAAVFETLAHVLRIITRILQDREEAPSAVIVDARTLQSTPKSGGRTSYDGAKNKNGSKVHAVVDTLENLLALTITAANEQERSQVGDLAGHVQQVTGGTVEVAYADQGFTGETAATQAEVHSIELEIVNHTEAKRGFVLLPKRWVVE